MGKQIQFLTNLKKNIKIVTITDMIIKISRRLTGESRAKQSVCIGSL